MLAGRPIRLPVLNAPEVAQSCHSMPDRCERCALHNRECRGCNPTILGTCALAKCNTLCDECVGFRNDEAVPGVCCKSPLKDYAVEYIRRWWNEVPKHKADPIDLGSDWIFNLVNTVDATKLPIQKAYGSIASRLRGYATGLDPNLHVRSFLNIPAKSKLVMHTVMRDVEQNNMGEQLHPDTLRATGIDYWTPMVWSLFDGGGMNAAYNYARTIRSLIVSKAQFVPASLHSQIKCEATFLRCVEKVRNVVIEIRSSKVSVDHVRKEARQAIRLHNILDKEIPFLVLGVGHRDAIGLRKEMPGRRVYTSVHARMILRGLLALKDLPGAKLS